MWTRWGTSITPSSWSTSTWARTSSSPHTACRRYHDRIHVTTEVEKLGNKSLTIMQRVVNSESGVVCVECRTVMAGYRRSTSSSEVIPPEVREWLLR